MIVVTVTRPGLQRTGAGWGRFVRLAVGTLFLIDAIVVFNSERWALHDHLAGTQVVDPMALSQHKLG
jgi:hypothetical protein